MFALKRSLLWSIPLWVVLAVDTYLAVVDYGYLGYVHAPGFLFGAILDPIGGNIHAPSMISVCICNCLFYSSLVWLVTYLILRARQRRRGK